MEQFILELGAGFTFVARQKRIVIDGEDFYLDLLFYHRKLRRLVAVDLKLERFKAADKGQMELYLRWLEKHEMEPGEETADRADPLRRQGGRADRAAPARPERHPGRLLPDRPAAEEAPRAEAPRVGCRREGPAGSAEYGARDVRLNRGRPTGIRPLAQVSRGGPSIVASAATRRTGIIGGMRRRTRYGP